MEFNQAMGDVYAGLYSLSIACELLGLIPPMPYEENNEAMYRQRFSNFKNIPAPGFIHYD